MPDKITYYAVVGGGGQLRDPLGLVRRLEFDGDGFTDEGLRQGLQLEVHPSYRRSGSAATSRTNWYEVSHEQASKIIEYFREKWGPFGQPVDS